MGCVRIRALAWKDEKDIEIYKTDGSKIVPQNHMIIGRFYVVYICYNINCKKKKTIRNLDKDLNRYFFVEDNNNSQKAHRKILNNIRH